MDDNIFEHCGTRNEPGVQFCVECVAFLPWYDTRETNLQALGIDTGTAPVDTGTAAGTGTATSGSPVSTGPVVETAPPVPLTPPVEAVATAGVTASGAAGSAPVGRQPSAGTSERPLDRARS